jgi:hypothetical protein
MDYQSIYKKYQNAIKLRELSIDDNYSVLRGIFNQKILDSINLNTQSHFIPYLAGIKEVFFYVENEAEKVDFYREELDRVISSDK